MSCTRWLLVPWLSVYCLNMVLMVAFGVYCLMGLIFFIMGIVYMGDAGTIGATGIYMMALGIVMLIIGGIALWANNSSKWMLLFVIELINIALFLVSAQRRCHAT